MSDDLMHALVATKPGGPDTLQFTEVPVPAPARGEVRIRVERCGLNPLDVAARRGDAPWFVNTWPAILGIEFSGIVDQVGEDVDESWLGQSVTSTTTMGGNAAFAVAPVSGIYRSPEGIDADTAAVYRGACHTAFRILEMYGPPSGSGAWVLVHSAAGTIGPILTQLAKASGARVIGLTSTQEKSDWAAQFGADHLVVATGDDWVDPVRKILGDEGIALAVDGNGGKAAVRNLDVLAPFGTAVFIGASSGEQAPALAPRLLIPKALRVAGFSLPLVEALQGDTARVDALIVDRLRSGDLKMPIARRADFSDLPALHAAFEARELMGRTLIRME
ncbi:zinc-binding dehydrogenase [Henriciella sp. AS95]|uniref:quinone oxidoreductase family protein n=1 Tax=Henriciella sp. AS95 TaxID=3135782 RepID=UPI0031755073